MVASSLGLLHCILEVCVATNRASHHWPGQTGNQGKLIQEVDPTATHSHGCREHHSPG